MLLLKRLLCGLAASVIIPSVAYAQAALAGVVKDSSGAVVPGVIVEAASDVLIEKVRSAVSDGAGQYQIVDLRPGIYIVTFTLTGFASVRREGVELTGTATTTANAEMSVGAVTQTITVTGETLTVDIHNPTRQQTVDSERIGALPTSRIAFALGVLTPGVSSGFGNQDVGGAAGPQILSFLVAHGSRLEDQRTSVNGLSLSSMVWGGGGSASVPNASGMAAITFETSAVSPELATGGVRINFIPRDGGNRFSGTGAGSFANASMQAESFRQVRQYAPVRASTVRANGEINPGFGGPILQDRVWFFLSARYQKADLYVPGIFHDKNANNPRVFTFEANLSRPGIRPHDWETYQGRVTWQAAPRHKIGVMYEYERNCGCPDFTPMSAPEAGFDGRAPLVRFVEVDWNMPVSSKLLIEASAIQHVQRWGQYDLREGGDKAAIDPAMIGVTEQSTGFSYRAPVLILWKGWDVTLHYRAALSYVTGSHAFKAGFNNAWGRNQSTFDPLNPYSYGFIAPSGMCSTISCTNVTPFQINEFATPFTTQVEVNADLGAFVMDKWTVNRWTLSAGARYDHFKNSFPPQTLGPGPLVPERSTVTFPRTDNLNWHDLTPKLGAVYDLAGDGKTAIKASLNKYLHGYGTVGNVRNSLSSDPNPIASLVNVTTRNWFDANGDFTPDCALTNPFENGECGALQDPNFGSVAAPSATFDTALLNGWGKRQYNWELSLGMQHELRPRLSIEASYFRRWYGNFQVSNNTAYSAADFDVVSTAAPLDPDLPGGGGFPIPGVYNLKPSVALEGRSDHYFVTLADRFGKQTEHWNGVDVLANARLRNGVFVQSGVSTGRTVTDNCALAMNPELAELNATFSFEGGRFPPLWFFPGTPLGYCHANSGFRTQVKGVAAYTIPRIDVQVAGTFQSLPGPQLVAYYDATGPGLGFLPFPGFDFKSVQVVEAGTVYGDRVNQLDIRVGKLFKIGRTRSSVNLDLYNALNSQAVLAENPNFAVWRQPTDILQARFFKISAQFDY
jgi:hypothetical protein